MTPVEQLLNRLDHVHKNGAGWTARCSAHDDRNPSLSIKVADDGRVLVHCHAGCTFVAEVADVLGISRGSVYTLIRSGELHPIRVGQRARFEPADVRAYLERNREGRAAP